MSWQDEQRRLHEEMSAGQLSAEDYRRRRDELATRHGGGDDTDDDGADDQPATGPGDEAATPFPPAFRWETTRPDEGNETTQLFTPFDADETQVVTAQPGDTDRTQVVRRGPPPPQGHQGWAALDSTPRWASSDSPPVQPPNSDWMRQQVESFESKGPSGTPRIVAVVAGVVVLLVLVVGGFATYWLAGGGGAAPADQPAAGQAPPPAPAQPPRAADEQQPPAPPAPRPGADLPDPAEIGGDGQLQVISTRSGLRATEVLTPREYTAVADAGTTASKLIVSSYEDGPRASVLITRLSGGDAAAAMRDELAAIQEEAGFLSAPTPDPDMKSFYLIDDPELGPTVRGFYRSGDLLVRMEVVGQQPVPTARRYDIIVEQQIATLPPDA